MNGLSYKGSERRRRQSTPGILLILIVLLLFLSGEKKLAYFLTSIFLFSIALVIGYFGIIKKDLDNKYVSWVGGVSRLFGVPKTEKATIISGYFHLIFGILFGIFFLVGVLNMP